MTGRTLVLLTVSLGAAPAAAAEITHAVRKGDSLAGLAKHYYDSSWKAVYIAARNGLEDGTPAPGRRVIIPAAWTYKVRRGDSFARIAKKYLGSADRHGMLMQFNGIKDAKNLKPGDELLMPFHLKYVVKRGDSYSAIAKRFYRSTKVGVALRNYNGTGNNIQPGQRLVVPIFDRATVAARDKGPPPKRSAPSRADNERPGPTGPPGDFRAAVEALVQSYLEGEFETACAALEELLAENMARSERITTIKYLGFCSIASNDYEAAEDYFRKWIEMDPKADLDPVRTSPKTLGVFRQVAEQVAAQRKAGRGS